MKTWVFSDLHLGHTNIIKYCQRPWSTVEEMNAAIIDAINSTVDKDDYMYDGGDFCMGGEKEVINYLNRIRCKNHFLVMGNHDRFTPQKYVALGFKWASRHPIIIDEFYILSHKRQFLTGASMPYANIFGHEHNSTPFMSPEAPWYANVSIENIGYKPILLDEVKEKMLDAVKDLK
jgi:calcineurin-like phosphoesterase family protein